MTDGIARWRKCPGCAKCGRMTPSAPPPPCPVCRAPDTVFFMQASGQDYWRCPHCAARFLDPAARPVPAREKAVYDLHENHPDDPGYRRFLSRLAIPLLARLGPGATVLDYGCGPGPALAAMLAEAGHDVALWDPLYAPDPATLARRYDALTCTEVAEHFHDPAAEFDRMGALLRPGGWLAVMTCFQTDDARFANWHYRHDPTHVVFYRRETLAHVAARRGWRFESPCKDVALMQVPQ